MVENRFFQDTSRDVSREMWQTQAGHRSNQFYVCDDYILEFENDYIFVFATEVNEETTMELDDVLEENFMTVYVKTINGKTISINATENRKQLLYRMKSKEDHRSREAWHTLYTKEKC